MPIKPLHSNNVITNSQGNPLKMVTVKGVISKNSVQEEEKDDDDERRIDLEIEAIEKEISRLSSRLEALSLEKAEKKLKTIEKRGRIVSAKFIEQKQSVKIEEQSVVKMKMNRRGVSLGPAEILSGAKSRLFNKQEMVTPVSTRNRRVSCFWKLGEIDELRVTKERGKSSSVSPRSRKTGNKVQVTKHAVTTVGSKKPLKKEDGFLASIQPKTLFKDGEKSAPNKKSVKPGRVVASRYQQISTNQSNGSLSVTASEARKRSLPDNDKEDGNKRRASRGNGVVNQKIEGSRVKKRWEIPSEVVVYKSDAVEESSPSPSARVMADVLPKIRTSRCVIETPRDSGAAKRVADLIGRRSYFGVDVEEASDDSICQALSFIGEDDED